MPVESTHPSYDAQLDCWLRIRDVLAGERAVKAAGEKYVARLDSQSEDEFRAYVERGFFYNATARTVSGYIGMIFRRDPVLELPEGSAPLHPVIKGFVNDVDLVGTTLDSYSRNIITEVISLGRAGSLVDWQDGPEDRAYVSMYAAEAILNWRETRINGQLKLSLLVLSECAENSSDGDPFVVDEVPQLRVLKLIGSEKPEYQVEVWQLVERKKVRGDRSRSSKEKEWKLVNRTVPTRRGKPLSAIPFVFHGPTHSRPAVSKSPIEDMVAANLDHYRLNVDYKHGMHFTALPTAFVTGFDRNAQLRIGSTTAWVTETIGATASYLEFKGEGLSTFERALDRVERLLAILGSRLLESQKRVSESAEALALRQAGESSIIASIAGSVTASVNEVLRWVYWWHSTEENPEAVTAERIRYELNSDFEASMMSATEIQAIVAAWQSGAISRDTMLHNFRAGEILPPGRTNDQELTLIERDPPPFKLLPSEN